jgi:ribonuclease III
LNKTPPEERLRLLEERFQVSFAADPALGLLALTHKSYANEHKAEGTRDNERLEFLGDAVVDLAISHRLMERFPQAAEGELSKLRALLVNEEGLARVARRLALGDLLLLGRGEELTGGRTKDSVLADGLEAVFGAVYLGQGYSKVQELIDREFAGALDGVASGQEGSDYKTRLQERIQVARRISPKYRVVGQSGPDHEKIFEIEVTVDGEVLARASGRSKKEAEQSAARAALEHLDAGEERFDPGEGGE